MLTQAGHWSWKMSIINYIFYLSVIHIIAFLTADCSPTFHFLFQGTEQLFLYPLFTQPFSPFPYCHLRLILFDSEQVCFLPLFSWNCWFPLSPMSERWTFWSLKCHLKSHFFSRSTNFSHFLNNKIWSKAHLSQWEPFHYLQWTMNQDQIDVSNWTEN